MQTLKTVQEGGVHVNIAWLIGIIAMLFGLVIALVSTVFWTVINNIKDSIKALVTSQGEMDKAHKDSMAQVMESTKATNAAYKEVLETEIESIEDRIKKEEEASNDLYNHKNEIKDRLTRVESCVEIIKKQHDKNHS